VRADGLPVHSISLGRGEPERVGKRAENRAVKRAPIGHCSVAGWPRSLAGLSLTVIGANLEGTNKSTPGS
jgi:hypothetical protein